MHTEGSNQRKTTGIENKVCGKFKRATHLEGNKKKTLNENT